LTIYELLRLEHQSVRDLLNSLIEQPRRAVFKELRTQFLAHSRSEEDVFYDCLSRIPNRNETAELKTEEHHLIEELLDELAALSMNSPMWKKRLRVLQNLLESHVADEETNIFAMVQPYISERESQDMVLAFEQRREVHISDIEHELSIELEL
jgi:hemerythrin superfamily protein